MHISARECDSTPEEILTRGLNQLKAAPLKPQQRLYMVRSHLLPKLHHKLVLSRTRGGVLNRLDRLVRKSVRSWLKRPHDAFIHSDVKHGGLGIPALRLTIPFMKSARLRRLAALRDPVFVALVASSRTFAKEVNPLDPTRPKASGSLLPRAPESVRHGKSLQRWPHLADTYETNSH